MAVIRWIRSDSGALPFLIDLYRKHPAQFICDWGFTLDPKNVECGLPDFIPFVLFPRQRLWIDTVVEHWRGRSPLLTEKTRQMGFSWLSVALACTLCLFNDGVAIGFGSRKEEYVDRIGDPKSLFQKARTFLGGLPTEFRAGWDAKRDASHMRILFPGTRATITGEAGDNIGRGNTTSIYFVDESAFLERPLLIEASLSQTTNCRIDISTPNGMNNPFAQKRFGGKIDVFTFHWRDDPRKDDKWYAKQVDELDPVTVAQEIDINYSASVEGVVIPAAWVNSSIDAHIKLGIEPTGAKTASLDVADEGVDLNAFCAAHGVVINEITSWSGKGGDIFATVERAFNLCDSFCAKRLRYDADGLGAGVRGDAKQLNLARGVDRIIDVESFRGSESPANPTREDVKGRKNQDFFANRKAQAWWSLRNRFQATHRAVAEKIPVNKDDIISISSSAKEFRKLCSELSQPTYSINQVGKIVIDKTPSGMRSPNLADAVMMQFSEPKNRPMTITNDAVAYLTGRR